MKKRIISLLMATAMVATMGLSALAAAPVSVGMGGPEIPKLTDVNEKDWYFEAAYNAIIDGVMSATKDGKFHPEQAMTREGIAVMLYRDAALMGKTTTDGGMSMKEAPDYAKITPDALGAMSFCYYAKILTGDQKGNLNPQQKVTREEMATLLQRFCAFVSIGRDAEGMAIREFRDYDAIHEYARPSITYCMTNDLMKGHADGSFAPQGIVTRAECAQMYGNLFALTK